MARPKFDGVVEAVRYNDDGQIQWVRAFLRRGPTWSDRVLLERESLINLLKTGKRFFVGRRVPQLAGTFETSVPIKLVGKNGKEIIVSDDVQSEQDSLKEAPRL
jgi:hypothetical protein